MHKRPVGKRFCPRCNHLQELLQSLTCARTLLIPERGVNVELVFIQYKWPALWIYPDIKQQVNLLDVISVDTRWFGDIAIPTLARAASGRNIENIEPPVGIVIFYKTVSWLKTCVAEIPG